MSEVNVTAGKCYRITAGGTWTNAVGISCGPDGVCPKDRLTGLGPQPGLSEKQREEWYLGQHPRSALIARIGDNPIGFFVGAGQMFIAPDSGPLSFAMNDPDGSSKTRRGKLDVLISAVEPRWTDARGLATIVARIDDVDLLHITPDGAFWEWGGHWARVGEHEGHFPTIINGILWWPKWIDKDHTEPLSAHWPGSSLHVEIDRVIAKRGIVERLSASESEVSLRFTDAGSGSSQVGCAIKFSKP